jgi:hypothetical protein
VETLKIVSSGMIRCCLLQIYERFIICIAPTFTQKLEAAHEECTNTYSITNILKEINGLQVKEADVSFPNFGHPSKEAFIRVKHRL